ncbi:MAG: chromosome partitioning protein ParA [Lachnospiraceae bacterium]|nr:chromosome partitioning protein ParA [Lachnospiraceae bacterium]
MRIRLAILENDKSYLSGIVNAFGTKFADKLEIYSFTDPAVALQTLSQTRIDVLVVSDAIEFDHTALPRKCGFAYLVGSADIESFKGQPTIYKFQKADLIYKQILNLYSEQAEGITGVKIGDGSCTLVGFLSPAGGVGTSSAAAAYALHYAKQGKRALYLNLERFGSADIYFEGDGQFDMSDVIFAVKSRKANLAMKLESCVRTDLSGVSFFSQTKYALDMLELSSAEMETLLTELKNMGAFDVIAADLEFGLDKDRMDLYKRFHTLVMVGDGGEQSNSKIERACQALTTKEQNADAPLYERMVLFYNKFSNKSGRGVDGIELRNVGGAPRYERASAKQVIEQLSDLAVFDEILK